MSAYQDEFDVVVVGSGPGGLASALTLGSYGVETLVVDRRPSASTLPRATVASTATMELLRRWGLEEAARERSIEVEWQAWACETLAASDRGEAVEVGLPTREQAALVSPSSPACLAQDELEPLMERRLGSLSSVRLERGTELTSLDQTAGGYLLTLALPGEPHRRVRARYVVGADGLRSRVREELGISVDASEGLAQRLAVVFRAPLWELLGDRRYGIYFVTNGSRDYSFLPVGKPDRWMFAMSWEGADEDAAALAPEQVAEWLRGAAGDPVLPVEIERTMPVGFGVGLADRFRNGNAFLIGDAAHRVTPRGGTGLNTAIRDGFDIGWKLAWVLRGWAGGGLLDSYERERRPVAEFNADRSSRPDGSILGTSVGLNADIGGRVPHVWVARDAGLVSTLDLLGDGLTRFAGPDWDGPLPRNPLGSPPIAVERLDAIAARGLGLSPVGSLLARPDGQAVLMRNGEEEYSGRIGRESTAYAGLISALRAI
jgi:2-polyprenyl-6-methoxyphenol hydroxylase-like FAD-dependent oxidoreductase